MENTNKHSFSARFWHLRADTRIQCDLCPRFCSLHDGQRGFCFVRKRVADEIVLTTYGKSSGFCIDPIEKKPLNHFYPGSSILSFGTAGCNLGCRFCQNWSISKSKHMDKLADNAQPVEIAEAAVDRGCRSVAFTYNDPVIFLEYAVDIAKECRKKNVKTVAVTAGYISDEARPEFFENMDAANVDLKAFSQKFYSKLCLADLQPVLDTLVYLKTKTDVWFEITTLLIPGENDSETELEKMSHWLVDNIGVDVPLHFTAFHPDFKLKDRPPTPKASLDRAREIALAKGIRFVYTGNVFDREHGSTFCTDCRNLLIDRDWYKLGLYALDGNQCSHCGEVIPGRFDQAPGSWGRRREPLSFDI